MGIPPFSKGEVSLQDSNPSLEKRGRGDFARNNYVAVSLYHLLFR
jgi:hypothetical protein